jgi:uncharacterized protein YdbL (DUF1318 family)
MRKILVAGGLTAAAVAAVIGAASTNAISGVSTAGAQTVGYGSAVITGAQVDAVVYNVNTTQDDVLDSVAVTFHANPTVGQKIQVGFGTAAFVPCVDGTDTSVSGVVVTAKATYTCTLSSQSVTNATKFRLLVTDN